MIWVEDFFVGWFFFFFVGFFLLGFFFGGGVGFGWFLYFKVAY